MLNIVIPMAGYSDSRPLIAVQGQPLIKLAIDKLRPRCPHRFIFICQRTHVALYGLRAKLCGWAPGCALVELEAFTDGTACTVLAARGLIDSAEALMIADSGQYVDCDIDDYLAKLSTPDIDGGIMTMRSREPERPFVVLDADGYASRVVEQAISDEAAAGIYSCRRGRDFVSAVEQMIFAGRRVNGQFRVAPAYNELIARGRRIAIVNIGTGGVGVPAGRPPLLDLPLPRLAFGEQA